MFFCIIILYHLCLFLSHFLMTYFDTLLSLPLFISIEYSHHFCHHFCVTSAFLFAIHCFYASLVIQMQKKLENFVKKCPLLTHADLAATIINNQHPSVTPHHTRHHLLDVVQHLQVAMTTRNQHNVFLQPLVDLMQQPRMMTVTFCVILLVFIISLTKHVSGNSMAQAILCVSVIIFEGACTFSINLD